MEVKVGRPRKVRLGVSYSFQKSLMYAIQAITNEPTHKIMETLVNISIKHVEESGIDLTIYPNNYNDGTNHAKYRMLKKYIYYPNTKLYVGCYTHHQEQNRIWDSKADNAYIVYNFKFPTSCLELNGSDFNEYITDGILCDSSKDIEELEMKSTLTNREREIKKIQKRKKP